MVELKTTEQLNAFEETLKEGKRESAPIEKVEIEETEEELEEHTTEEEIQEKEKKHVDNYSTIIEELPELKYDLDYLLITKKIKSGKELTEKEQQLKETYEEAKQKEQEFNQAIQKKMEEEQDKQKELQEQVNKEYEEHKAKHPENIDVYDSKTLALKGSDNFLKVATTWMKLIKSHKKGGKIFIKVARPKKVSIEWTNKDLRFVEFWSKNERGDAVKEVTRISQFEYTFDGTSIPVLFAVQGFAESFDFYSEFRKDLTAEIVSGIAMEAYNTGFKDGCVLKDAQNKNGFLESIAQFMPIIMIIGFLVMGFLLYQMWGEMNTMYKLVTSAGFTQQLGSIADVNTLILR